MNDIHPHWQSTNEREVTVNKAPLKQTSASRVQIAPARRLPAAVVSIVAVTVLGITLFGGWDALRAQVANMAAGTSGASSSAAAALTTLEIRITNEGFSPNPAVVKPGQEIVWINEQSIPHILTSQTLRDTEGKYLNTTAIFPAAEEKFTVGASEPDRDHSYTSTTDQTLLGTITVSKTGTASASSVSSSRPALGNLDGIPLPTGGNPDAAEAGGGFVLPPVTTSSAPPSVRPAAPLASNTPDQLPETIAPESPHPAANADTGPEVWIVLALSIAALFWGTRAYFAR